MPPTVFLEEFLHFQRGHAARACCRNGLAVAAVLHVAAGENARHHCTIARGEHVVGGAGCTAFAIEVHLAGKHLGVGLVADAEEQAADRQRVLHSGDHVAQAQAFHIVVFNAQHLFDHGVGAQLDVGVGHGAVQHDLGGAEAFAAMQQRDLGGEASEEQSFFHGRVAAAHYGYFLAAEEESVAGGAA